MAWSRRVVVGALTVVLLLGLSSLPAAAGNDLGASMRAAISELRAAHGLAGLALYESSADVDRAHADFVATLQPHRTFAISAEFYFSRGAVAFGETQSHVRADCTVERLLDQWLTSPPHLATLLTADATHLAVAATCTEVGSWATAQIVTFPGDSAVTDEAPEDTATTSDTQTGEATDVVEVPDTGETAATDDTGETGEAGDTAGTAGTGGGAATAPVSPPERDGAEASGDPDAGAVGPSGLAQVETDPVADTLAESTAGARAASAVESAQVISEAAATTRPSVTPLDEAGPERDAVSPGGSAADVAADMSSRASGPAGTPVASAGGDMDAGERRGSGAVMVSMVPAVPPPGRWALAAAVGAGLALLVLSLARRRACREVSGRARGGSLLSRDHAGRVR